MTVQAGIELDLDLELLVGEMPKVPCEHREHTTHRLHSGEATWYARAVSECCNKKGPVRAVCTPYVEYVKANGPMRCASCRRLTTAGELTQLLGPIK